MSKIVTRLYDSYDRAEQAVIELIRAGIPHDDVSLVSHRSGVKNAPVSVREPEDLTAAQASGRDSATGGTLGGLLGASGGVLAGLGLIAIPGLGPVVAAGWLAAAAVGAVVGGAVGAGAGGIVGALTHAGVSQEEAEVYAESVRRGGTLVSAKVENDKVALADYILDRFGYVDIRDRRSAYENAGWTHFNAQSGPYSDEEIAAERDAWAQRQKAAGETSTVS